MQLLTPLETIYVPTLAHESDTEHECEEEHLNPNKSISKDFPDGVVNSDRFRYLIHEKVEHSIIKSDRCSSFSGTLLYEYDIYSTPDSYTDHINHQNTIRNTNFSSNPFFNHHRSLRLRHRHHQQKKLFKNHQSRKKKTNALIMKLSANHIQSKSFNSSIKRKKRRRTSTISSYLSPLHSPFSPSSSSSSIPSPLISGTNVIVQKVMNIFNKKSYAKRLYRELLIVRLFSDHPNIIKLYDIIPPKMELCFNELLLVYQFTDSNLSTVFHTNQFLSGMQVKYILYQLFSVVCDLHRLNITHGDLQPSNIFINKQCVIQVSGFNLVCLNDFECGEDICRQQKKNSKQKAIKRCSSLKYSPRHRKTYKERIADNYDSENDEHKQIAKMRAFKMELLVYGFISDRKLKKCKKRKKHKTQKHTKLTPPPISTIITTKKSRLISGNMNTRAYEDIYLLPRDMIYICLMYYNSSFKYFSNSSSRPSSMATSTSSSSTVSSASSTSSSSKRRTFIKNKNKGTLKRSRRVRYAPNYKSPEQIFDAFIEQFKSVTPVTPPISDVFTNKMLTNTLLSNQHRDYSSSSPSSGLNFSPSVSHSISSTSNSCTGSGSCSSSSSLNSPLLSQPPPLKIQTRKSLQLFLGVLMSSETTFTDIDSSPSTTVATSANTDIIYLKKKRKKKNRTAVDNAIYKISMNKNLKKSKFLECAKAAMMMNNTAPVMTNDYHKIHINGRKTESSDLSPVYHRFEINEQQFVASDIWSIGCIMGELLQMQREIRSDASHRNYLFSMSCLTRPQSMDWVKNIEQMQVVFDVIGTPTNHQIQQIVNKHINTYLKNLPTKKPNNLRKMFEGASVSALNVLYNCLKFDVDERITAEQVLHHSYFNELKDNLVNSKSDEEKKIQYYSNLKRSLRTQIPNLDRIKIPHLRRLILKEISMIKK